ncbi:adenosylcobinamide-GDP ribazoletransferase [Verminephrobacter aporrectodeae subsp. tuberculatae]|uniref:adenosylcobinamide-GDP ribazoletransferase n=1 Tax=Verminephrobacter aporrectodeae TaxID=1110389 RepID=UPI0022387ECE|nr:adenosylcobinamide-GDP ribazoletransferase [Verminephrobacter aporrectodeae]MCW5222463.1 adenosylcobinamide-GDP ribazoletransferase [Verminephrobacter aporrectodeae subsp. tuberculatae]MCW5287928.1 adenosylcobinamide-GDP ribazoletransferase [Verminephrobacter aporrectodeae subsp. tuberculatae]
MQALRHYLLAVQFFTRVPVTGPLAAWVGYSPAMLHASAAHLPGVGWLVALVAGGVYAALYGALAPSPLAPAVAAVFCTLASVLVTGGLHEDGLADLADGLGGSADRARSLDIMKDARIGAFGVLALVLALLAKLGLLALLGAHGLRSALVALAGAHVLSRLWPLLIMRRLPHVGDAARSRSRPLAGKPSGQALAAAALWCFAPLALVGYALHAPCLMAAMAASGLAAAWMLRWFARRLQGYTGDCLGAAQQVGEIGFYLGAALALRWV